MSHDMAVVPARELTSTAACRTHCFWPLPLNVRPVPPPTLPGKLQSVYSRAHTTAPQCTGEGAWGAIYGLTCFPRCLFLWGYFEHRTQDIVRYLWKLLLPFFSAHALRLWPPRPLEAACHPLLLNDGHLSILIGLTCLITLCPETVHIWLHNVTLCWFPLPSQLLRLNFPG